MCAQHLCQPVGDPRDADVPGDMPRQLASRDAQIAKRTRQDPSVVVRGEQKRRCPLRVHLVHGGDVTLAEELIGRLDCV